MARCLAYLGDFQAITAEQVAAWRRNDAILEERQLLTSVIIPGVVAQCEARTGAAIRPARYREVWEPGRKSGDALDRGQAFEVESVDVLSADGVPVPTGAVHFLERGQRESYLHFAQGRPPGRLQITYKAGLTVAELDAFASVRTWLLMQIGTVHAQRETLVIGATVAALPSAFIDTMLADIELPPRF